MGGSLVEKVVPLEYALGLLTMDDDKYRERARGLHVRAIEMPRKDAYDDVLYHRAVERLAALDALNE